MPHLSEKEKEKEKNREITMERIYQQANKKCATNYTQLTNLPSSVAKYKLLASRKFKTFKQQTKWQKSSTTTQQSMKSSRNGIM